MKRIIIIGDNPERDIFEIEDRIRKDCLIVGYIFYKNGHLFPDSFIDDNCFDYYLNTLSINSDMIKKRVPIYKPIISYFPYRTTLIHNPIRNFIDSSDNYDGILMGMSHSQCSIDETKFKGHFYKMASPSMDMFCHYNFFLMLCENSPQKLTKIKRIVIELPYYIFNFDLSKFSAFVKERIYYFFLLKDYHHFGITEEEKISINEVNALFSEIIDKAYDFDRYGEKIRTNFFSRVNHFTHRMGNIIFNNDKVWIKDYKNTIAENKQLFADLLNLIQSFCPNSSITICVFPFNPLFIRTHKTRIQKMRNVFYDVCFNINPSLSIVDDFTYFKDSRLFLDHCHLNKDGGKLFSDYLSRKIK